MAFGHVTLALLLGALVSYGCALRISPGSVGDGRRRNSPFSSPR